MPRQREHAPGLDTEGEAPVQDASSLQLGQIDEAKALEGIEQAAQEIILRLVDLIDPDEDFASVARLVLFAVEIKLDEAANVLEGERLVVAA
jgi:hypothetical protein